MFSAAVFVPGKFQLTNQMLSDLRAAGYFEGYGRARYGKQPKPGHDAFAEEVELIRMASLAAWRDWGSERWHSIDVPALVSVRFFVVGHHRHDPDAWYLLAKPAIDGMAKGLSLSDRFAVYDVAGRVARRRGENYYCPPSVRVIDHARVGFWMSIAEAEVKL